MKLHWLKLKNWRQFEGETPKIEFAQDPVRNVTVIHGSNGSGKTAILNALTWVFHNKFTDALAMPDQLVNKRALSRTNLGDSVEASVEVRFDHGDRLYHLKRTVRVRRGKTAADQSSQQQFVSLLVCGPDGKWVSVKDQDISDTLGRIIPEQLLSYFFFDGERIERLQRPDRKSEIVSAVTMLIGELVLNRSIDDLKTVSKRLWKEMQRSIKDDRTAAILTAEVETLESQRDDIEKRKSQLEINLDGYMRYKQAIQQELRRLDGVKYLQEQRDARSREETSLRRNMTSNLSAISGAISTRGWEVFITPASQVFLGKIEELRARGELPSSLKLPFLRKLLDQQKCICGRELTPGEEAYAEVLRWMEYAGLSEIEETAIRMEGEIARIERDVPELYEFLDNQKAQYDRNKERLSEVEKDLARIREELKGSSEEDARNLEQALERVEQDIERTNMAILDARHQIELLTNDINKKRNEVSQREARDHEQAIAQQRVKISDEIIRILEEVRRRQRLHFRADLSDRINRIFSAMSFKPYTALLNEDYSLTVYDGPRGIPVPISTGERQILSLSFIGAVIEQAREFSARQDRLPGPDSSTFPVVMDSPFGSLDPHHRRQVAEYMPRLANQVVILSTRSQWENDVEHALEEKIGKEYVLAYFSPKSEVPEDSVVRRGQAFPLVSRSGDDFERTEIVEVSR